MDPSLYTMRGNAHCWPSETIQTDMAVLDHIILKVNDLDESVRFYTEILGFEHAGPDGPFEVIRVGKSFQMQLAPWGTDGHDHLAFALSRREFDSVFDRVKSNGIEYGPSFHEVGTNSGPGEESGARGPGPTLYFNDPNKHLIEIRTYS